MMNKRQKKKTQKELGYIYVGAWLCPDLHILLASAALSNGRSVASELTVAIKAHVAAKA